MGLTFLLYNFMCQDIGDVGNLEPIFSSVFETPLFQNRTILDLKLCKHEWKPSLCYNRPEPWAGLQQKSFQRDQAFESHGGYGFQILEMNMYTKIVERCGKKNLSTLMEVSWYSGILKSQGI